MKKNISLFVLLFCVTFYAKASDFSVKVTQNPMSSPVSCGTATYVVEITNNLGTALSPDIQLTFASNTIVACTTATAGFTSTPVVSGGYVTSCVFSPTTSIAPTSTVSFTYDVTLGCGSIPSSPNKDIYGVFLPQYLSHNVQLLLSTYSVTYQTFTNFASNTVTSATAVEIKSQISFPAISAVSASPLLLSGHVGDPASMNVTYSNTGTAAYSGSVQLSISTGCNIVIPIGYEVYINGSSTPSYTSTSAPSSTTAAGITTYTFNVANIGGTALTGQSIAIKPIFNITACIPGNNTCNGTLTLSYGCANSDICRTTNTLTFNVSADGYAPTLTVYRTAPVASTIPTTTTSYINDFEWDAAAMNTETEWVYVLENLNGTLANTDDAKDIVISLVNMDPTSYSFIRGASVSCTALNGGTSVPVKTTVALTTADFASVLPGGVPACFTQLDALHAGASSDLVKKVTITLANLLAGEKYELRFKTFRCAPTNQPAGTGVNFNKWSLNVTGKTSCNANVNISQGPYAAGRYKSIYGLNKAISIMAADQDFSSKDLFLNQEYIATTSTLLGSTPEEPAVCDCGAPQVFNITNSQFQTTNSPNLAYITGTLNADEQLYSSSAIPNVNIGGDGPTGYMPKGKFKYVFELEPNLRLENSSVTMLLQPLTVGATPISWAGYVVGSSPTCCGTTTVEVVFDMADLHDDGITTGEKFKAVFNGSKLQFSLKACCPLCGTLPGLQKCIITTSFAADPTGCAPTCTEYYVPLKQVDVPVQILCPGCVRPGVVVNDFTVERTNLGFYDVDDDGITELNAGSSTGLFKIDYTLPGEANNYSKYADVKKGASITGDEILAHTVARFQDGDDTDPDGFSYAAWKLRWPGSVFEYLYIEQDVLNVKYTDIEILSAKLKITQEQNGIPVTYTVSIPVNSVLRNNINSVGAPDKHANLFKVDASSISGFAGFNETDVYEMDVAYKICKNPTAITSLEFSNNWFYTSTELTTVKPNLDRTFISDMNYTTTPKDAADPDLELLYICTGGAASHALYPVTYTYSESGSGPSTSCNNHLTVSTTLKVIGPASTNAFPFEYRFVPTVDELNYTNGLSVGGAPFSTYFIPPIGYDADNSAAAMYSAAFHYNGAVTQVNHTIYPPAISRSGTQYWLNTAAAVYEPLWEDNNQYVNFSANNNSVSSNFHANKNVLVSGDEFFSQAIMIKMRATCPVAAVKISNTAAYCTVPDLSVCGTAAIDLGKTVAVTPGSFSFSGPSVWSDNSTMVGPYTPWALAAPSLTQDKLTFFGQVRNNHLDIENAFMYVDLNSIPTGLNKLFTFKYTGNGQVMPNTYIDVNANSTTYRIYRFDVLATALKFNIEVDIEECAELDGQNVSIPVMYGFDCDGPLQPSTTIPPSNICPRLDTLTLNYLFPSIHLDPTCSFIQSSYTNCSPVTLRSCVNNSGTGGVFGLTAQIELPNTLQLIPHPQVLFTKSTTTTTNAVLGALGSSTTLPTYVVTPNTSSNIYTFDLAYLQGAGFAGANGLSSLGGTSEAVCIQMQVVPRCDNSMAEDIVLAADALKFSGTTYCGEVIGSACSASIVTGNASAAYNCINVTRTVVQPNCTTNTGSITITYPTSGYNYIWSDGVTTMNRTGLAPGTYLLRVVPASSTVTECGMMEVVIKPFNKPVISATTDTATCYGVPNAAITVTPTGGVLPYTYQWLNSTSTSNTRTGLVGGNYRVTVTDNANCSVSAIITAAQPHPYSQINVTIPQTGNVGCYGGNNGWMKAKVLHINNATVTVPLTYSWSNSGPNSNYIDYLTAGTYTLLVTTEGGCTASATATITQPAALATSQSVTPVGCSNSQSGAIDLSITGGTTPYTYLWSNGATSQDISGLSTGVYNVVVTDMKECSASASATVTSSGSSSFISGITITNLTCHNAIDGAITYSLAGTAPYTFSWSDMANSQNRNNLAAGVYTVTITDANSCSSSASFTVAQPAQLSILSNPDDNICYGGKIGSIDITVSGGTTAYTYLWSTGSTTEDLDNLTFGPYSVTVTDANLCSVSMSESVAAPTAVTFTETHVNADCDDNIPSANGSITVTPSGGTAPYTYLWSNSVTTATNSSLLAGTYYVSVWDSYGCEARNTIVIGEDCVCGISSLDIGLHYCIPLSTGGNLHTWSFGINYTGNDDAILNVDHSNSGNTLLHVITEGIDYGANKVLIVSSAPSTISPIVETLTFEVTEDFTDDICIKQTPVSLACYVNNILPTCSTEVEASNISVECAGLDPVSNKPRYKVSVTLDNNQPTSVLTGEIECVNCTTSQITDFGELPVGLTNAEVYVTPNEEDATSICINYAVIHATKLVPICMFDVCTLLPSHPSADIDVESTPCVLQRDLDLTATGGTSPYTYLWNDLNTSEDRSDMALGNYTVTVSDANGCAVTAQATVAESCKNGEDAKLVTNGEQQGFAKWIPNPSINVAKVIYSMKETETGYLYLFDVAGKLMLKQSLNSYKGTISIDVSSLSLGVYNYKIVGSSSSFYTGKVVIASH